MAGKGGIRRIIELALDAASARRMRDEAQKALDEGTNPRKAQANLSRAEAAFERLKGAAIKIGAALAAAFALDKIRQFGVSAVQAAVEAEAGWSRLGSTLRGVGVDMEAERGRIEAAANGIKDSTRFDDDEVVGGLQRMVSLTGDYQGSLARLQLVADLAADQQISFSDASEQVAKVMNGGTRELKQYGLDALGAEAGLAALGDRLSGRAAADAQTFGGQLAKLNVGWGDFTKEVGFAIIAGSESSSIMGTLRGVLSALTGVVARNREGIAAFVSSGINVAVFAAELLVNGLRFLAQTLTGKLLGAIGMAVGAWAGLVDGMALAIDARVKWNELTGDSVEAAHFRAESERLHARADELHRLADAYKAASQEQFHWLSLRGGEAGGSGQGGGAGATTPTPPPLRRPAQDGGPSGGRSGGTQAPARERERTPSMDLPAFGPGPDVVTASITDGLADAQPAVLNFFDKVADGSFAAADALTEAFGGAFENMRTEGLTIGNFFEGFFQSIGKAASGALADYAKKKSTENFLKAAESVADGLRALANPLTAGTAPMYFGAAAKFAAVGALWGAAFGAAGSIGASLSGGGGGGHGGVSRAGRAAADGAEKRGPEVHVYVDGIDPNNARHQDLVASTMTGVVARHGADWQNARITVHPRRG